MTSGHNFGYIPLIHTTDLLHPPIDPDDHFDLATVYALLELDVCGIILDINLHPSHEAGFIPVSQLNYLTGRFPAVAVSPPKPLRHRADTGEEWPLHHQAGIKLLLNILRRSPEPVYLTVAGSSRTIVAAFNREPELLRAKTRAVLLNAGFSAPEELEYNVAIDVHAFAGLLESGLPIWWFPCGAVNMQWKTDPRNSDEHSTYWCAPQAELLEGIAPPLLNWFIYSFTGNGRGDILRALSQQTDMCRRIHELVRGVERQMWCTASLVMAAGRVLAQTPDGWRFVPQETVDATSTIEPLSLEPVSVSVTDEGHTVWQSVQESHIQIFCRTPGERHTRAMTEALNALLHDMPIADV